MWAWGINDQRFLAPQLALALTALSLLFLIPTLSRRLELAVDRTASRLPRVPGAFHLIGAATLAAVVGILPDQTWFTGDFILRLGSVDGPTPAAKLFPQALPLDLFLHVTLPRLLSHALSIDARTAECLLGILKAAALGALSVELVRLLRLRAGAAVGGVAIVAAGGYLGMLTGSGQAFGDMCVILAAVGVFGLRVCLDGRAIALFSIATALGLLIHREGLALIPPWIAVAWIEARRVRGEHRASVRLRIAWLALPLVALLAVAPRIVALAFGFDRQHLGLAANSAGPVSWILDPRRLLDLANLTLRLCPLVAAIPLLAWFLRTRIRARADTAFLLALALPWIAGMLLVHPEDQGLVRDWGTFAPTGVACALIAAWLFAEALHHSGAGTWIGLAVLLGCATPSLEQLLVSHDPRAGMSRVRAYIDEPPSRPDATTTLALDYLGTRYSLLGDWQSAAETYERAASITPAPRVLYNWALAEANARRYDRSRQVLERLIARAPTSSAYYTLAAVSYLQGDLPAARQAALQTLRLAPGDVTAKQLLDKINRTPTTDAPMATDRLQNSDPKPLPAAPSTRP
jgi:tetratricopeptide (TPR) repeat protein